VPDLLHAFDVFVLPSVYEGLPLALIEAMAAGAEIVAARVDSVPEALGAGRREGLGGVLVPPCDASNLAAAIEDVLAHPVASRRELAQARAQKEFDVSGMVARYAELYDALGGQTLESQPPSA